MVLSVILIWENFSTKNATWPGWMSLHQAKIIWLQFAEIMFNILEITYPADMEENVCALARWTLHWKGHVLYTVKTVSWANIYWNMVHEEYFFLHWSMLHRSWWEMPVCASNIPEQHSLLNFHPIWLNGWEVVAYFIYCGDTQILVQTSLDVMGWLTWKLQ